MVMQNRDRCLAMVMAGLCHVSHELGGCAFRRMGACPFHSTKGCFLVTAEDWLNQFNEDDNAATDAYKGEREDVSYRS